jgi:hypothetical protein
MIGTLTFILAIALLGVTFGIFNPKNYFNEPDRYGDRNLKPLMVAKLVGVILVSLVLSLMNPVTIQRLDAGNVGL